MLNKYFKTELILLVLMNGAVAVVQQLCLISNSFVRFDGKITLDKVL